MCQAVEEGEDGRHHERVDAPAAGQLETGQGGRPLHQQLYSQGDRPQVGGQPDPCELRLDHSLEDVRSGAEVVKDSLRELCQDVHREVSEGTEDSEVVTSSQEVSPAWVPPCHTVTYQLKVVTNVLQTAVKHK